MSPLLRNGTVAHRDMEAVFINGEFCGGERWTACYVQRDRCAAAPLAIALNASLDGRRRMELHDSSDS